MKILITSNGRILMEILGLIEELEEIIEDASTIPFSAKIVIDKDTFKITEAL